MSSMRRALLAFLFGSAAAAPVCFEVSARSRAGVLACLLALATWLVATPMVAAILFFPVMILAGPHSSLLPRASQGVVLIAAWGLVIAIPVCLARAAFRRLAISRQVAPGRVQPG
jgi:hypothetical protein